MIMNINSTKDDITDLSVKDKILITPATISGLLCLGLSFGLNDHVYRDRFFVCLLIFAGCIALADRKKLMLLTFACFFAIRALWSIALILISPQ